MSAGLAAAAAVTAAALGAAPAFVLEGDLEPKAAVEREAMAGWAHLEEVWSAAAGDAAALPSAGPIRIRRSGALRPGQSGASAVGEIALRQDAARAVDERLVLALRHELAHQFLWKACPAGSADALFQEAFALATSGEIALWNDGEYLSLTRAREVLEAAAAASAFDSPRARRALARALIEGVVPGASLPRALVSRVRRCADGARWQAPLSVGELFAAAPARAGDAFVVISRHSGEVLWQVGDAQARRAVGSTLKPFVVAGAETGAARSEPPVLVPRGEVAEWRCAATLPDSIDWRGALVRSCNGYFLDWAQRRPEIAGLGAWGPVLEALGLEHAPRDMPEAIGLRTALTMTPLALAHAYRLLGEARPDVVEALRRTAVEGTLAGLPVSPRLAAFALKTGTVRDSASEPQVGWVVAMDADRVAVMVRPGLAPRKFAEEFASAVARQRAASAAAEAVEVQTFGLVDPEAVEARCPGVGVVVARGGDGRGAVALAGGEWSLGRLARRGATVCAGAPWKVRLPGARGGERDYAGVFAYSPAPKASAEDAGPLVTERQRRARRGSDLVFRTTRLLYTAGVLKAEDARLAGEARAALARIVAHNARIRSRHAGRPVCDTTHCQVFQGTVAPRAGDAEALARADVSGGEWLSFSAGGDAPWREERTAKEVERVLGAPVLRLGIAGEKAVALVVRSEGGTTWEESMAVPCEALRSALRLPSCPSEVRGPSGGAFTFSGRGAGHGVGLDVERARSGGASQEAMVREARPKGRPDREGGR